METSSYASSDSAQTAPTWVESLGGPLIAIPVSVVEGWGGCTMSGIMVGDGDVPDDYDRACEVEGLAGVVAVDGQAARGLVLADMPARTCYLAEHRVFVRWLGASSEAELIDAARTALTDPATHWEECGLWESDGHAVLMDSTTEGADLNVPYPLTGRMPEQAPVPIPPGRWTVRAADAGVNEYTSVGLVQLLPASA
ncbi:Imm21 family immunity protein [Streptomyces sp. NPDC059533]|uniref:Imm21 family immunity protein n=1 Tax=unclassified Streptomyces TaxID=2593676 RepID=UPI003684C7FF